MSLPLTGKTILLTRTAADNEELATLLSQYGARCISFPTITIAEPESWTPCDHALEKLHSYSGVVFTSRNAVDAFIGHLLRTKGNLLPNLAARHLFAVGEKTRARLEAYDLSPADTTGAQTGEELALRIAREDITGMTFLFPKGDLARETVPDLLRGRGAAVEEIVVYRTLPTLPDNLGEVRGALDAGILDAALFFSPSAFVNFVSLVGKQAPARTHLAAVGDVTAGAMRDAGFTPSLVASAPAGRILAAELVEFLGRRQFAAGDQRAFRP